MFAISVIRMSQRVSNNCNLPYQSLIIPFLQEQNNSTASPKLNIQFERMELAPHKHS